MSKEYIGVREKNAAEGEVFGYYWEDTKKNRKGLLELKDKLPDQRIGDGEGQYLFIFKPLSHDTLSKINSFDTNTYMSRVNMVQETNWHKLCDMVQLDPLYKGRDLDLKPFKE